MWFRCMRDPINWSFASVLPPDLAVRWMTYAQLELLMSSALAAEYVSRSTEWMNRPMPTNFSVWEMVWKVSFCMWPMPTASVRGQST